ncbi:hypothetical protein OQJ18_13430 [Fluoribacter dumoffii]|uniref:Uncharacterized protein n=1 Tax=Fluoribacter dumoffii TaxID=463 RepID=A0A377GF44_9GAMM|nr:hypothetical protein [Fluoribacter dumoffii]KTC91279.1 hypothetical protein Ldum_2347 [Fluoribacter dumoffii NY 23]MCW8387552.1 hypothetical protein [Fluoribacter dumoffii]MCW8416903.1 hypothetical protein [Fluoribacter dumoffii]MCW8455257.1 hypothetical protein [Fluoribacter dumoffii]MCW8460666.1 hypothetical protein [Fluoribacter dumoffii]
MDFIDGEKAKMRTFSEFRDGLQKGREQEVAEKTLPTEEHKAPDEEDQRVFKTSVVQ